MGFRNMREFWDYCREEALLDEVKKTVRVNRIIGTILRRAGPDPSHTVGTILSKTTCNNSLCKLTFPLYITEADL
jgi:hypothetical protein